MKQALTIAAVAIGFIAGASALSALAQTGGTWTPPTAPPPAGNVDSPINTGMVAQQKNGWLGVTGLITANLQIASGTPGFGNILVSDANGNASWQPAAAPGDTCALIATTDSTHRDIPIAVPSICINGTCSLFMSVINISTGLVDTVSAADLIEVANSAKASKGADAYWWSKPGSGADHSDCSAGRNGTTDGCDLILGSSRNDIGLYDDRSGVEMSPDQWSMIDENNGFSTRLYACK